MTDEERTAELAAEARAVGNSRMTRAASRFRRMLAFPHAQCSTHHHRRAPRLAALAEAATADHHRKSIHHAKRLSKAQGLNAGVRVRRGRGRSARGAGRRSLIGIDRSASSAMVWGRAGTLVAVAQTPRLSGHTGSRALGVVRWLSPVAGFRTHASVSTATRTRVDDALMSASAFSPRLIPSLPTAPLFSIPRTPPHTECRVI